MKRIAAGAALVVALAVAGGAALPDEAVARTAPARARKVLLVSYPRLTWQAVLDARPPVLLGLLRKSAVASMSVRTIGPRTSLGEGYATIGAGNRAAVSELTTGLAFGTGESFQGQPAAAAFKTRTGFNARGLVHLGIAEVRRLNRKLLYGTEPGAFGAELIHHDRRAAVVANADRAPDGRDLGFHREAALAVVDRRGRGAGTTGPALTVADPAWPYGRRADVGATVSAFKSAWATSDVVVLEMSDLERADAASDVSTPNGRRASRAAALTAADEVLAQVLPDVDLSRHAVLVVGPAAPRVGEQLTVAAMAGPGVDPGKARSGTTRRRGYVTLADVAPTALRLLGVAIPDEMTGAEITSAGGGPPSTTTFKGLADDNERAVFRDDATGPASVIFVVFQVLGYGLCVWVLARRRDRWRPFVGYAALVTLAIPALAFLSGLVRYDALGVWGYVAVLYAGAAALAGGALRVGRRDPLIPPLLLIGLDLGVLVVDVLLGGRLQINTAFGYSPIVAGRFAGFGNLAFALVATSAIVVATGLWGLAARQGTGARPTRWVVVAVIALLAVTVLVDGHPSLGSDVGGVLASVPAFFVAYTLVSGLRVDWRRLAVAAVAAVGVLAVFAAIDLARPSDERSHLGRLLAKFSGPDEVVEVAQRKLVTNLNILTSSVWTLIIPVALAFLVFLAARPPGLLHDLLRQIPGIRACLVGAFVAGALGFALNDSGVAVPAMMLAVVLPHVTFLLSQTAAANDEP